MKNLTITLLISISIICLLGYNLSEQKSRNQILLWENINLRGYKNAYLEHVDKCDSIHEKCFSMEDFKTQAQ